MSNHRGQPRLAESIITLLCLIGVFAMGLALMFGWFAGAKASVQSTEAQARPACGSYWTWQHRHSAVADRCRDYGWTIKAGIVVSGHAVVKMDSLRHCREEDGSGQAAPCTWNLHRTDGADHHTDGNSQGLVYWVGRHDHIHYVWPERPLGEPTPNELADALVEGPKVENWKRCWLDEPRTHVRCPDGYETRVWGQ